MPQLNKGGKFVFGKSLIREGLDLHLRPQAVEEYDICCEGRVYLFTGAKATGGFCVTRRGLLLPSKLGGILNDTPKLRDYILAEGEFVPYKGRSYCWLKITPGGWLQLTEPMVDKLSLSPGTELLCIRSSNIAFTLGHHGPLLERAKNYQGGIPIY